MEYKECFDIINKELDYAHHRRLERANRLIIPKYMFDVLFPIIYPGIPNTFQGIETTPDPDGVENSLEITFPAEPSILRAIPQKTTFTAPESDTGEYSTIGWRIFKDKHEIPTCTHNYKKTPRFVGTGHWLDCTKCGHQTED